MRARGPARRSTSLPGTAAAIAGRWSEESLKAPADPELEAKVARLGLDPAAGASGTQLAAIVRTDIEKWAKVIKEAGITAGD